MKPELIERRSKIKSVPKDNDDVELTEKKQYIALTRRKINELLETWDIWFVKLNSFFSLF